MENILENTSASIWAIDTNYRILYLNSAFRNDYKKTFGVDLEQGDNIIDKLPVNIQSIWKSRYERAMKGEQYAIDDSFTDKNNHTVYVHVSLSPLKKDGGYRGVTCFGRDVTQEKLNEIALHKYSILLKSSLESQNQTILLSIDKDYNYMYFNKAHFEVMKYAYNVEVEVGMNILDCITNTDDRNAAIENYSRALNGESHSNIRVYGVSNKEYYESYFNPIRDDDDQIVGATALARNITKRIEQEEALRIANSTKDKFLSLISHDLRSPIASVKSLANLVCDNFDEYEVEEQKLFLKNICKGVDTTYLLLEDLLLWSRSQTDCIVFKPEKIDLSEVTNINIDVFDQNIKTKELDLKKDYPPSFEIFADKQMISTIIRNLLSNAIKFSHKKGMVKIGFERLGNVKNNEVLIYVSDSGVGISKENMNKLFLLGENISTPGTDREVGSGLGLIMCKEFIDKHSGEISVDSEVNRGTKISVVIPQ